MPKAKKIRSAALEAETARHDPLGQEIVDDANRRKFASMSRRQKNKEGAGDPADEHLDGKSSQRILNLSRAQQLELQAEEEMKKNKNRQSIDSDEESVVEELLDDDDVFVQQDDGYVRLVDDAPGMSAEDEALVASMMNPSGERKNLADLVMAAIHEKEATKSGQEVEEEPGFDLPPKVVEVYTEIGKILSRYTSGKLPKAFKVIPSLSNWEEVLYLTRPDRWTPQAMYQATRIFASNLNPKMAQRFYYLVLLDAVRADIAMHDGRLNVHLYESLKKSVYKPAAFFKGILLPLCKENCTLREAAIVSSVLQRVSIPVHHSAVALFKLAGMEYSGASSIFIKALLNKKYSLPAPVISALVSHFAGFVNEERDMPVLWHQAFLVFVQRYKNEIRDEAQDMLKPVMKKQFHHQITPEIRRELFGAKAYTEERKALGDDKMIL